MVFIFTTERLGPDEGKVEGEVWEEGTAGEAFGVLEEVGGMLWAVAVNGFETRVNKPAQLCPVGDIFFEFALEGGQIVARGFEF